MSCMSRRYRHAQDTPRSHRLALSILPYLRGYARRKVRLLASNAIDRDDVVGAGYLSALQVAERYDPGRAKFLTYALRAVNQTMDEAVHEAIRLVRVPYSTATQVRSGAHVPDPLSFAGQRMLQAAAGSERRESLAAPIRDRGRAGEPRTLADVLPIDAPTVEDEYLAAEDAAHRETALRRALDGLPARHRAVVEARMRGELLREIATRFGVSKARVEQLEKQGHAMLRDALRGVL